MATLSFDPESVRGSVRAAAQDNFFRGLVSSKLGSDRILDDELIDLIVSNPLLDDIFDDLCNSSSGLAKVRKAVEQNFPTPSEEGEIREDEYHNAACRQVWMAAVDDPRFNIVLKQAQDEARLAPPVVRGSGLSGILGVLDKIRAALTSGASKHSDATLAGSVLAALLGGALAQHYIAPPPAGNAQIPNGGSIAVNSEVLKQLTTAVNSLNNNVAAQTSYLTVLNANLLEQTKALNNMPNKYGDSITNERNSADLQIKIADFDSSLTYVTTNVKQLRSDLDATNGKVNTLAGQVDFAAEVKKTLEQIAYGIGPTAQEAADVPSLRKSSNDIADALWALPQDHTGSPTSPSNEKTQGSPATPAPMSVPPARSNEVSVATSLQTLAGIAKTVNDGYIRGLPVQSVVSKEDSTQILERVTDGAPCAIRWHLESHTAVDVTLSVFDKDCQSNPPQNPYNLVVDNKWKQVQGTKSEVRWDRTERTKWWSLFDYSAVLALYQK